MLPRYFRFFATFVFFVPISAHAQGVAMVEIGNVQLARSLTAVVHDSGGSPIVGVLVEELSSDWKESLRSTKTDAAGIFTFTSVRGRDIYYFQLTFKNFNPLRVRVKINHKRGKELELQMYVST